jgi:hypothetical protein
MLPAVGCDEPARPRRPPADTSAGESTDDIRSRRRGGARVEDDEKVEDERFADQGLREERRRPDYRGRESTAAEDAEDARDAAADRPTRPKD